jgi:hypothetical protein
MEEIKLSNGTPLTIDFDRITHNEWVKLVSSETSTPDEQPFILKLCGLTQADMDWITERDWSRIIRSVRLAREALVENPLA